MELLEGEGELLSFVDREYVYVPSGASGYVDEFICQIDRYQDLWYILQDVNYNVIALTDSGGEVVRQHTFDPYGEILTAEDFDTHPGIKVGHQGLFFDRLEPSAPAGGLISMSAAVQLQPGVFGLYQARNRVLLPRYGRWAQKDPNASGMLHATLWRDGEVPMPELAAGSLQGAMTDSSNLFAFVGNSPFNATDPSGLISFLSTLSTFGKGMAIAAPWLAASATYSNVVAYNNNEITGTQLATDLILDALLGGTFWAGGKALGAAFDAAIGAVPLPRINGLWIKSTHSAPPRAIKYQGQITGRPGEEFLVNGVKFDGEAGGILLEAKGLGYSKFIDRKTGDWKPWWGGAKSLLRQAERQIKAANGSPIIWKVAEEDVALLLKRVLPPEIHVVFEAMR